MISFAAATCGFEAASKTGKLASNELDEVSGVVASRRHPGVVWVHNDSGGQARVFAVGPLGEDLGSTSLNDVEALDWEDLTLVPGKPHDWLILGDIGDNRRRRGNVLLHRIAEPKPGTPTVKAETMVVRYPDGAHNSEVLLSTPDGRLYLVSKERDARSTLYAVGTFQPGATTTARTVGTLPQLEGIAMITGGDVRPDGKQVALRTYTHVQIFSTPEGLEEGLLNAPCAIPWVEEPQGEAITYTPKGLLTISEREGALLNVAKPERSAADPRPAPERTR